MSDYELNMIAYFALGCIAAINLVRWIVWPVLKRVLDKPPVEHRTVYLDLEPVQQPNTNLHCSEAYYANLAAAKAAQQTPITGGGQGFQFDTTMRSHQSATGESRRLRPYGWKLIDALGAVYPDRIDPRAAIYVSRAFMLGLMTEDTDLLPPMTRMVLGHPVIVDQTLPGEQFYISRPNDNEAGQPVPYKPRA